MVRIRGFEVAKVAVVVGAIAVAGCSESATGPEEPTPTVTFTVDASNDWALVALGSTATVVTPADPTSSTEWDIGFNATAVKLNSGAQGSGDVVAYCVCQNADATPEDIQAMTAASELADYEAIDAADIPAAGAWTDASETPGGPFDSEDSARKWYWYDMSEHVIWPRYNIYLVKSGSEVYKIQILNYYGPAGDTKHVTFRSARISG